MHSIAPTVPHLTTALKGPLHHIETELLAKQNLIETWFRKHWLETPAPFYASVDLRNAGFKIAPVDTNLFPAGFNNLNPAFHPLAVHAIQSAMERVCPMASKIVVVPENHTRNLFYLESVATIVELLGKAGYDVRIGSLIEDLDAPLTVALPSGKQVVLDPLVRQGDRLGVNTEAGFFNPCSLLLNNDLSAGQPELFAGISQTILPPPDLGWDQRLKSNHFSLYSQVVHEFAEITGLDPWLFEPLFKYCGQVDFKNREEGGNTCLSSQVGQLLKDIQAKYDEYGIEREPFVVVKADAGTYGMGIMVAKSVADVENMNKKQRNKMSSLKEGKSAEKVIIQEGVYTEEEWEGATAEPVVYMVDHFVVGGFYRVHSGKGATDNLNAPGMHFEPLAFAESCSNPDDTQDPDAEPNRFYTYGVIARLALLAAAREKAEALAEAKSA